MGIDPSNLYKYETGENDPPIALLKEIAKLLGVTLDQLYPTDLAAQEPQHPGWRRFRETDLGKSMTPEELTDMAAVRLRNRMPTEQFYQMLLLSYRTQTQPVSEEETGVHNMQTAKQR